MMRFNLSRHFLLTCGVLSILELMFAACVASPNLEKTTTAASVVIYSDHLPQAGGSGDEAVSKAELKNQLKILAYSPPFEKIPAVWGLSNSCRCQNGPSNRSEVEYR